jgi:uncharacterized protein YfdQ (DUF2303 family)
MDTRNNGAPAIPAPDKPKTENLLETAARELPVPHVLESVGPEYDHHGVRFDRGITRVAVPKGWEVREYDDEKLLDGPRRLSGIANIGDLDSFIAYANKHVQEDGSAVWCAFDPRAGTLSFTAVFDEHRKDDPAWRAHRATFTPKPSVEWSRWLGKNGHKMSQFDFALFLEDNIKDVLGREGSPTDIQMLELARNFTYRADKVLKSVVRTIDGGQSLEYVDTADAETAAKLKVFERFWIAIPVWEGSTEAYPIEAKLRTPRAAPNPQFSYDLTRPDLAHRKAAEDVIGRVREAVHAPLYMGSM